MVLSLISLERFKQQYPNAIFGGVVLVKSLTKAEIEKFTGKPQDNLFDPSNNLIPNTINGQGIQNDDNVAINRSQQNENIPSSSNGCVPNKPIIQEILED